MRLRVSVLLLGALFLFSGCDGVFDSIRATDARNPGSALSRCNSLMRDADGDFSTKDQLACDCMAIDGRDPKCWGYREYRSKPQPLGLTPEAPRVEQNAGDDPEIPLDGIVNAGSFMNRILAAGGIARGAIFTIFGSNIGTTTSRLSVST